MQAETDDERRLLEAFRKGWPILHRSHAGFMVRVTLGAEGADGPETRIEVPLDPPPIKGAAEANYVEAAIAAWQKRLDEYRLLHSAALGSA